MHVLVLIRARDREAMRAYEAEVVPIMREHGGKLLSAFRPVPGPDQPDEVHLIEFEHPGQLDAYRGDPRVMALASAREAAIASTSVIVSEALIAY